MFDDTKRATLVFEKSSAHLLGTLPAMLRFAFVCIVALIIFITSSVAFAATITTVSSTTADGTYTVGDTVEIQVTFDEAVTVTETPTLALNVGGVANYESGSGSTALTFRYAPILGHQTSSLDYTSTSALGLNGGTITTTEDAPADLTLPSPGTTGSLSFGRSIAIDAVKPTVSLQANPPTVANNPNFSISITFSEIVTGLTPSDFTVTNGSISELSGSGAVYEASVVATQEGSVSVVLPADSVIDSVSLGNSISNTVGFLYDITPPTISNITSSPTVGGRKAGDTVDVLVQFTESVFLIDNPPMLTLETGDVDRDAVYISGSGSSVLRFRYTVEEGDASEDLSYISQNALTQIGGSLVDQAGNTAVLTLPAPGEQYSLSANSGVIIDTIPPTVSLSTSHPSSTDSDLIPITITFSEPVTGFTADDIAVSNGAATLLSGGGANYTAYVVPRVNGSVVVSIPAGRAIDRASNGNELSDNQLTFSFSTNAPTVLDVYSSTPDGEYKADAVILVHIQFSESVLVDGTPRIKLSSGNSAYAYYAEGSGTNTLTFLYTVSQGENSSDLDYGTLPPLSLQGGAIRDAATDVKDARFTFAKPGQSGSLSVSNNIIVDTIAPVVSYVTSSTPNGAYHEEEDIQIQVVFSETIVMTGTPSLALETGATDQTATFTGASGRTLSFLYTIVDGDNTERLDYLSSNAFSLNDAVLTDRAGNIAVVTLPTTGSSNSLAGRKNIIIDTIHPWVDSVSSTLPSGRYKAGTQIPITVSFSEAVTVTGTPHIALQIGTRSDTASYTSGSGSSTITFSYTVQAGDSTESLRYLDSASLSLAGGAIFDRARNDADLPLPTPGASGSLSFNRTLALDTDTPQIISATSSKAPGVYSVSTTIHIEVIFDEPIVVTGTPEILLNTTPSSAQAVYKEGSGTNTLIFEYIVDADENSADLGYIDSDSLTLPSGATIRDIAGNDAILILPDNSGENSLQGHNAITIDTLAPTVVSVTSDIANGFYRVGAQIPITVIFSEPTYVSSNVSLRLGLDTGTIDAVYVSGTGSTELRFHYVVGSAHNTADLEYFDINSLRDDTASILDQAGNASAAILPTPGSSGSLGNAKDITIDNIAPDAPVLTDPAGTTVYRRNSVLVKGTAEPFSEVSVTFGTTHSCQATTSADSSWECQVTGLEDGIYYVSADATDRAGNLGVKSSATEVHIENDSLTPPTITSPTNEMTTESQPVFAGTGHPNKLTKIFYGATEVCTASVSSEGAWSCTSLISFSEGYYPLIAYTEDPIDSATSTTVDFTLAVGQVYSGTIKETNREQTPLEGVRITDGVHTVETDVDGTYTFVVPLAGADALTASKYGWSVTQVSSELTATSGSTVDWLATPHLEQQTFAIWFTKRQQMTSSIHLINRDASSSTVDITTFNKDGSVCESTDTTTVESFQKTSLEVPLDNCIADEPDYGLVKVDYSGESFRGSIASFNQAVATSRRVYSYGSMELQNEVRGTSYSQFDTAFYKDRSSQSRSLLQNELFLANVGNSPLSFTVTRYKSDTTNLGAISVSVAPKTVGVVEFEDSLSQEAVNGIDYIVPSNPTAPYIAMRRRAPQKGSAFGSLEPSVSSPLSTVFSRVQYFPTSRAVQYAEISNASSSPTEVTLTRYSRSGRARPAIHLALQPHETRKIRLSRLLRKYTEGALEITSSIPNALIVSSVVKHYNKRNKLRQIHITPLKESFGDLFHGVVSASIAQRTLVKLSNMSSEPQTATVSCLVDGQMLHSNSYRLRAHSFRSVKTKSCMMEHSEGVIEVNASAVGVVVPDLIHYTRRDLGEFAARME